MKSIPKNSGPALYMLHYLHSMFDPIPTVYTATEMLLFRGFTDLKSLSFVK